MTVIVNTKLGMAKGKPRVWLEGAKLLREGFIPGARFDVIPKEKSFEIKAANDGKYTISRRESRGCMLPVIDVRSDVLAVIFDGVEILRAAIRKGVIVITAHHQQQMVKERNDRFIKKVRRGLPLDFATTFHGGGILDKAVHCGFKHSGLASRIRVAIEMEDSYIESSLINNPELWDDDSVIIVSPLQQVNLSKGMIQCDVMVAGIPCTGASKSGRTKNKLKHAESHESAGALFFNFLQMVGALNPALVWIENVSEYQNTASMEVIRSVLTEWGYSLQEHVFDSTEYGALEQRKRLCVIAISNGLEIDFDLSAVTSAYQKKDKIHDILEDVPLDSPRWKSFDYLAEKEVRDKAAGKGFSRQLLTGEEDHCGTIGKGYAKCRSTEPFIVHPQDKTLSRLFTPVEHARLKCVPLEVIEGLSDTTAHEILGQSVAFGVFDSIARSLGNSIISGLTDFEPITIETTDTTEGFIGGDDIDYATALWNKMTAEILLPDYFNDHDKDIGIFVCDGYISASSGAMFAHIPAVEFIEGKINRCRVTHDWQWSRAA